MIKKSLPIVFSHRSQYQFAVCHILIIKFFNLKGKPPKGTEKC